MQQIGKNNGSLKVM